MGSGLKKAVSEAERNIYGGIGYTKGIIVYFCALLCLFVINGIEDPFWATLAGGTFYISLGAACVFLFKGINRYLVFPVKNKKVPLFIGHRIDTVFVYPVLLMASTSLISSLLSMAGLHPANLQPTAGPSSVTGLLSLRFLLLPPAAFAEEMLNLLVVSFFYTYLKLPRVPKLLSTMVTASLAFGLLHFSAWGLPGSVSIGFSYMPVFFATLYTGNIWISFLAHFYSNVIAFSRTYYSGSQILVISAIVFMPVIWSLKSIFKKR